MSAAVLLLPFNPILYMKIRSKAFDLTLIM